MMVVMALVTTMATAPVLQWLLPQRASSPCNGEHPSDTRRAGVIRRQGRTAAGRRPIFRSPKVILLAKSEISLYRR
jgi:hypothetical protein